MAKPKQKGATQSGAADNSGDNRDTSSIPGDTSSIIPGSEGSSTGSQGSSTASGSNPGDSTAGQPGGSGSSNPGTGDSRQSRKDSILQRARNRRNQEPSSTSASKGGANPPAGDNSPGVGEGNNGRNEGHPGAASGPGGTGGPGNRKRNKGNSSTNQTSSGTDSDRVKPTGVKVDAVKLPPIPKVTAPLTLAKELTEKEAKDMVPRIQAVLVSVFELLDMGITLTNAAKAQAVIWSGIDEDEVKVLAEVICDGATRSKLMATAAKGMVRAHRLLQVGLITGPRFLATWKHYVNNGGFNLFPMGKGEDKRVNPLASSRQDLPAGQAGA